VLTVLTVFAQREPRDVVHEVCTALRPTAQVIDAASPTDAVMTLLAKDIDLVLVDVDSAGELLAALRRHVQRSAPDATLIGFGGLRPPSDEGLRDSSNRVRGWGELADTVSAWLQQWPQQA
jgi:ABC-type amino acid transport substrate-binding protein